ncbi:uncharacterized protein LOC126898425 [Daktulosphaira vitifoliae]|uniref:uncharacterized protein LOC126898425 n=1 Tax=Daktulosphaira vitifoliae TaxID=58002 RepID=UPI0021A9C958|nr:uncharacterized protein LOC126898425 [Daktulosphaira vitifoliae]
MSGKIDTSIIFGSLLDPIQEDEVVKRKDGEPQFVKDENGRRRFHGAFTGGFSAGFYNTVGSLEGWTPSNFKSSRDSKALLRSQNAYDFMDDEDKKDLGIDPSSLKVKAEYSDNSSRKRHLPEINTGPIPGKPVLGEILKPIRDTWGVELLKSMGWKPGQGVGPQVTQKEKLRTKKELETVGMKFKTNTAYDNDEDEINELLGNIKVSPFEYESISIKPKTDTFGLGYEGLKQANVSSRLTTQNKYSKLTIGGKSIHGQAFGVGAYEDDDDDIYAIEDMTNYDFSLENKSMNLKKKKYIDCIDTDCLEIFVNEDDISKNLFEKLPLPPNIPPDWRPQGMAERILGQCPADFFSNTSGTNKNVNTRQREIKKHEPPPKVEDFIKKEVPNLLSTIISDKFIRAVLPDDSTNALIPVKRTVDPTLQKLQEAADQKKYGFWTRRSESWVPDKLLCKRFNVPVPKATVIKYEDNGRKHGECSLFSSLGFAQPEPIFYDTVVPDTNSLITNDINQITEDSLNSSSLREKTIDLAVKPNVDFFKDIFLDDSDIEDSTNEPSVSETSTIISNTNSMTNTIIIAEKKHDTPETSHGTNNFTLFPPKGIFANLNFEELFDNKSNSNIENKNKSDKVLVDDKPLYGPSVLPIVRNVSVVRSVVKTQSSSDEEWIEKTEIKSKKSSHKHNKHKKKHKNKKKSHKHK